MTGMSTARAAIIMSLTVSIFLLVLNATLLCGTHGGPKVLLLARMLL